MANQLMSAAGRGDIDQVRASLQGGCDVDYRNMNRDTPIFMAASNGSTEVVRLLIDRGADVKAINNANQLMSAAGRGDIDQVRASLQGGCDVDYRNMNRDTPIFMAASNGSTEVVRLLIDRGADVKAINNYGRTPLILAAQSGSFAVAQLLLSKGADVKAADNYGRTPIIEAAANGSFEVVELLIGSGANIRSATTGGRTVLMEAALNGHIRVVTILANSGVDVNAADNFSEPPRPYFFVAGWKDIETKKRRETTCRVIDYNNGGASVSHGSNTKDDVAVQNAVKSGELLTRTNFGNGRRAIMDAARNGHAYTVQLLMTCGANAALTDHHGSSAAIDASAGGHALVLEALQGKTLPRQEGEAVPDADSTQDVQGLTVAAARDEAEGVVESLQAGCDVKLITLYCETTSSTVNDDFVASTVTDESFDTANPVVTGVEKATEDALTGELYAEYLQCSAIPTQLQFNDEQIAGELVAARKERRLGDVSKLKDKRASSGYTSSGVTLAQMKLRLVTLKEKLDRRYDELVELEEDDGCALCDKCSEDIRRVIDTIALPPAIKADVEIPLSPTSELEPEPAAAPVAVAVAVAVNNSPSLQDSLILQESLTGGRNSSGKSTVLDCLFTAAHTTEQQPAKTKIFQREQHDRAVSEYGVMCRLHKSSPNHFVRPFAFIDGSKGHVVPSSSEDSTDCCGWVFIVMERAVADLQEYMAENCDLPATERLSVLSQLLDVLLACRKSRMVLNDFKPANVLVVIDNFRIRFKATDFDNSRNEGEEMLCETTAAYCSPEVARAILAKARGEKHPPLLASEKMDIMALGWMAYEIANNGRSFWINQATPISSDLAILQCLASLTDEKVQSNIDRTFPGGQFDSLRSWLMHALRVNHLERATSEQLKSGHSLLGLKEKTVDHNGVYSQILKNQNLILDKIDELSEQLESSLDCLGSSLDSVAANIALGSHDQQRGLVALKAALSDQIERVQRGGGVDQDMLVAAVAAAVANMGDSVSAHITSSIKDFTAVGALTDPTQGDRLEVLMGMIRDLGEKSDRLAEDFQQFKAMSEAQSDLLAVLERNGNTMPLSFVILPEVNFSDKLDSSASRLDKMKNFTKRKTKKMASLVWAKTRIVFVCPVTLKQVKCGFDGNGYLFKIPTDLVKSLLPALKWGLFFLKVALATQGLGAVVPQLDLLCSMQSDTLDSMISQVLDDAGAVGAHLEEGATSILAKVRFNEEQAKKAYSHVYGFIADLEGGKGNHWRPTRTGLHLTPAPQGKGRSMWVSEEGMEAFQMHGADAIKKIEMPKI